MRFVVLLAILSCLPHLGAGRRVNKPGDDLKRPNSMDDDGFDDDFVIEDEWNPNDVKEKCKGLPTKKDKADCACTIPNIDSLTEEEVVKRCKSLKMPLMYLLMGPPIRETYSCHHYKDGDKTICRAADPFLATGGGGSNRGPENKVSDVGDEVNEVLDDTDLVFDDLDPVDPVDPKPKDVNPVDPKVTDKTDTKDTAVIQQHCAERCLPIGDGKEKRCDYFPSMSDMDKPDYTAWCKKECLNVGVCVPCGMRKSYVNDDEVCVEPPKATEAPVVVDERVDDEKNVNEEPQDDGLDELNELDEDVLGESDEVKEEKKKAPTLTCSRLVKSSTPHVLTTQAQLRLWCGGDKCGKKLKLRKWAVCELADGQVMGPGHGGQIKDKAQSGFDCYINCEGEAETTGSLVSDCISSPGGWGACSRSCGGGMQKRQLSIKAKPSGGGKACPPPPDEKQSCNNHRCPPPPRPPPKRDDCFPADALVETLGGKKAMSDLRVGDRIRSVDGTGKTLYDEVYFFGHADGSKSTEYVNLELSRDLSLQLSRRHFIQTCPQHGKQCDWTDHIHSYAEDILPGDYVWVAMLDQAISLQMVLDSSSVLKKGLFNPYTLSGKIVVNGVVVSAHSDWILDQWTPASMSRYLPAIYQVMFLPGRWLYKLAGISAADALDVNNPQFAAEKHGNGPEFLGFCFFGLLAIVAMSSSKTKC